MDEKYKVAVASTDGKVVNQHFGKSELFYIYQIEPDWKFSLVEKRELPPVCHGESHDADLMLRNIKSLNDCKYLLVSKIGNVAANMVQAQGITPMELPGFIDESIEKLTIYEQIENLF